MPLRSIANELPSENSAALVPSKSWFSGAGLWMALVVLVLVAVNVICAVRDSEFWLPPKPTSDGPVYENIAYHLSAGHGFWVDWHDPQWRSVYEQSSRSAEYQTYLDAPQQSMPMTGRPPLLPLLIAGVYAVVGRDASAFAVVRLMSAVCIAVACSIAVANAAQVLWGANWKGRGLGRWSIAGGCAGAMLLAASNRTLISYAHDFLTEPLALLLTQMFVTTLLALISRKCFAEQSRENGCEDKPLSSWWMLALAMALAAMILARSLFVVWLPGVWLLLVLIVGLIGKRGRWRFATQVLLLTLLLLAPWWFRNCVVLERFMPLGTQGPTTMLGGYCDEALAAGGDWQHLPEQRLRERMLADPQFNALPNDVARELMIADEAKRLVRAWMAEHVAELPGLFVSRVVTHWNPYTGKSLVWRLLILVGAIYLLVKRRPEAWVLVGLPVMNTILVACMYTTGGRFLVPLYGILFTLSAIGIAVLVEGVVNGIRWFSVSGAR